MFNSSPGRQQKEEVASVPCKVTMPACWSAFGLRTLWDYVQTQAPVNPGCTYWLMQPALVNQLGLRRVPLRYPILFEQMDGATLGGAPATHRTVSALTQDWGHWEERQFNIAKVTNYSLVMGVPWPSNTFRFVDPPCGDHMSGSPQVRAGVSHERAGSTIVVSAIPQPY
uniref:Uncharacterized protein n=1 Tax=Sphaerodactylus townsendi TaxID=933632 RepID=A0ACB8E731_9SAUR